MFYLTLGILLLFIYVQIFQLSILFQFLLLMVYQHGTSQILCDNYIRRWQGQHNDYPNISLTFYILQYAL